MKGATKMIRKHQWLLLSDTNTHRGCFCFVLLLFWSFPVPVALAVKWNLFVLPAASMRELNKQV